MLKILLISLSLIFINLSNSNNIIKGKILDKNTKEELAGVRIISDCDTVYSDFDGNFKIKYISDTTKLKINLISYDTENLLVRYNNEKFLVKK